MLVSGPSVASVTVPDGSERIVSTMKSTACRSWSGMVGGREVDPVEAGPAVDVLGGDEIAGEGAVAAGEDGDVGSAGEFADDAGVAGGQFEGDVAGNCCDSKDFKLGRGESEEDGDGVVLARDRYR